MNFNQSEWTSFLETGKIEAYLDYCQARKQEMLSVTGGKTEAANATEDDWNCPSGLQNRRG